MSGNWGHKKMHKNQGSEIRVCVAQESAKYMFVQDSWSKRSLERKSMIWLVTWFPTRRHS